MKITCPSCQASYSVKDDRIPDAGRKVRCSQCGNHWIVQQDDNDANRSEQAETAPKGHNALQEWNRDDVKAALKPEAQSAKDHGDETDPSTIHGSILAAPRKRSKQKNYALHALAPESALKRFWGLPTVIGLGLLLLVLAIPLRQTLVSIFPDFAPIYDAMGLSVSLDGLAFEDVNITRDMIDDKKALIISGQVKNISQDALALPAIQIMLMTQSNHGVYSMTTKAEATLLEAGGMASFQGRILAPPHNTHHVSLRFIDQLISEE